MADDIVSHEDDAPEDGAEAHLDVLRYIFTMRPWQFGWLGDSVDVYEIAYGVSGMSEDNAGGTVCILLRLPGPQPPPQRWELPSRATPSGVLRLAYLEDGRIHAELLPSDAEPQRSVSVLSCPVLNPTLSYCRLVVTFDEGQIDVEIGSQLVATTRADIELPKVFTVPENLATDTGSEDFSQPNNAARIERREKLATAQPKPGRIPGSKERDFKMLRDEVAQLTDLLPMLRDGAAHHALGIAARVRLLLTDGQRKGGLLQRCAAHCDEPLIVYTSARPSVLPPITPIERLAITVSGTPTALFRNPIDIDVWFKLNGARTAAREFTNREVIAAIGDTRASHADPDLVPLMVALETLQTALPGGQRNQFLVEYVLKVAEAVAFVAERLLNAASNNEQRTKS